MNANFQNGLKIDSVPKCLQDTYDSFCIGKFFNGKGIILVQWDSPGQGFIAYNKVMNMIFFKPLAHVRFKYVRHMNVFKFGIFVSAIEIDS